MLGDFPVIFLLLISSLIMLLKNILCMISFRFVEACFLSQDMVNPGICSVDT